MKKAFSIIIMISVLFGIMITPSQAITLVPDEADIEKYTLFMNYT